LRKALKLKASVFIIAWTALFIHNVIPHNHPDESREYFGHLMHNSLSCNDDLNGSEKISGGHYDDHVCQISNLLYHTPSPEILLSKSVIDQDFNPDLPVSGIFFNSNRLFYSSASGGICQLRAPPLS
jgi:hypothetical protein